MSQIVNSIIAHIKDREFRIRFLKFSMVGLWGVVVNQGILILLVKFTNLPFYLCSLIAIECSILNNFTLNDRWTWHDKREDPFPIRLFKYNTSTAFSSIFVNMAVLLFLKEWVGIPYQIANLGGIACAMLANFTFNHFWTYGSVQIRLPGPVRRILLISLGVRLLVAAMVGAGFDEAYYYGYSLHPALSYFDHPPFVGFLAGFFPFLTGIANAFTIRLGAILLFTISGLMLYYLAKSILDEEHAITVYALFNLIPLFGLGAGTMILPDAGLTFFWIGALFFIKQIVNEKDSTVSWIGAGIFTGLAFLSKYHGVLLGVLLTIYILIYRRALMATVKPWLYAVIAVVLASPVIVWNIQNDWISFTFQAERSVGSGLSMESFGEALAGQAAYLTPMIFVPMCIVLFLVSKRFVLKRDKQSRFFFLFGVLPVLFMLIIALRRSILPHWTLPGYILLLLPISKWFQARRHQSSIRFWTRFTLGFIAVLLAVATLHTRYGVLHLEKMVERGWLRERDFRKEATLDAVGWEKVPEYLELHQLHPDSTFLFTHKWLIGGELMLAVGGEYPVLCFNSLKNSRGFASRDPGASALGKTGVFVATNRYEAKADQVYGAYFQSISKPDTVVVLRGGVASKEIYFYKCINLLKPYIAE